MISLIDKKQINDFKLKNPSWILYNNSLKKEFKFDNFIDAFSFMTKVALLSEKINHHPNWQNIYNKVTIELTTHDMGGITSNDIKLAEAIDQSINT